MFEQLLGRRGGIEDLDQVADPAVVAAGIGADLALLVRPVRGQAIFGLGMHRAAPELDFDARVFRVHDARVQRAIAVALGGGEVILEPARHHRPAAVDDTQRPVAFLLGADDDAERHDVGELLEADVALGHLAPDRIGMLLAPRHLRLDPGAAQQQFQPRRNLGDTVVAQPLGTGLELLQPLGDRLIGFGFELAEGERLHLLHELVHADPLGERRVDVHRLARDPATLVGVLDVPQRAHVVQPVGQLDQQHTDVVGHRQQELAQVLRRALVVGLGLDLRQLGDTVHQPRDRGAEQLLDLFGGGDRVLDGVVEDGSGDRLVVEPQVRQDARDLDWMREIGIARCALLRAMCLHREDIGAVEKRLVGVGIVVEDPIDQLVLPEHAIPMGWRARQ